MRGKCMSQPHTFALGKVTVARVPANIVAITSGVIVSVPVAADADVTIRYRVGAKGYAMHQQPHVPAEAARRLATQYIALWNETDADRRQALAGRLFADGAVYLDPMMASEGPDGVSAMVAAAQQQFAGLLFSLRGEPEATGRCVRFSWSLGPAGGPSVAAGTDFALVDGEHFTRVTGFIDQKPGDPPPAG